MSNPFFSIVVASYNAQDTIGPTIESVLKQTFDDYEVIVKDGGSSDDTLSRIPSSEKINVYSSKDGGIYSGMNEGIGYSKGRYVCFLNCGDVFDNERVLADFYEVARDLENSRNILYGNYARKEVVFKQPSKITSFYLYRTPLCHQSMFFGRDMLDEFGGYDTRYRILADYNHTVHAFRSGVPFVYCDCIVCNYLGGGASETKKGNEIKNKEYKIIRAEYYSRSERMKNDLKIFLSMKKLRQILVSDRSPRFIRKAYRAVVNRVNH